MSLFFTLGSTVHDWGWPKNGPFWTKNGQTWQACQRSKVVLKGLKGTKMINQIVFFFVFFIGQMGMGTYTLSSTQENINLQQRRDYR